MQRHDTDIKIRGKESDRFVVVCSCGYQSLRLYDKRSDALAAEDQHVRLMCEAND